MNQFSRSRQMLDLSLGHATSSAAASTILNIDMTPRSPPKMANQGLDGTFVNISTIDVPRSDQAGKH